MNLSPWLIRAAPALGLGLLLTFSSSIGQTYFISLFAGQLRQELGLSHGSFGWIYATATLLSALALAWVGKLADHSSVTTVAIGSLVVLACCALLMAGSTTWWMLAIALFGLRLGGQGLLSHLALTAVARWFDRGRGRALGIAALGFSIGEAFLPPVVASLLILSTWREIWVGIAVCFLVVLVPISAWLGKEIRKLGPEDSDVTKLASSNIARVSWTRRQVLKDNRFYALLPGVLAPSFIITGILFHQVHLAELKGWTLTEFAACYPIFAASTTAVSLTCGWLVDRYGTARLLPFYLIPLGLGLALVAASSSIFAAAIFMFLMGATAGGATIVLGALWAELYGTDHLGAIRSLTVTLMVIATAIAPWLLGTLIDQGVSLNWQLFAMAFYTLACALWFAILWPSLSGDGEPYFASENRRT